MGRNHTQNQQAKEKRQEQLLSTALHLFAAKGLNATKISDIAQAAGVSQGLLYRYYKSKEEIYSALIHKAFTSLNEACHYLEQLSLPPHEKLQMAVEKLLDGLDNQPDYACYHLLIAQASASDAIPQDVRDIIETEYRRPYECIARIMTQGQKEGVFQRDNAEQQALLFWSAIKGLALYKAVHSNTFDKPETDIIMRMFIVKRS